MISTQMMKLAEANQWKVKASEDIIFGEYNGYQFTVLQGKRFKAFITPVAGISTAALEQIVQHLDSQKKSLKLRNYEISDNFLCVRMEEGLLPMSTEKIEQMLGHLSGLLDLYEVPADACVVCGKPAQRRGLYLGLFCHLHKECEQKEMVDFTADYNSLTETGAADADADRAQPVGSELENVQPDDEKQPEDSA